MSLFKLAVFLLFLLFNATCVMTGVLPATVSSAISGPTAAAIPTSSVNCSHKWCQSDTSMCLYWAGVTGYDPSRGPIPGMVLTTIGSCASPTTTDDYQPRKLQNHDVLVTPAPNAFVNCSYKYCDNSTQYCMYWAGVTGFDISLGPVPGMTRTALGTCEAPTSVVTTQPPMAVSTLVNTVCSQRY